MRFDFITSIGHKYFQFMFHNYLRRKLGERYNRQSPGPVPPEELIITEALMSKNDLAVSSKAAKYFGTGYAAALAALQILEQCSFDIGGAQSMLEFGCGSGRVIRHFRNIDGLHLFGTDANPSSIEWCRRHLCGIQFYANDLQPPLAFADEFFDAIYAYSVFTHIPLQWQRAWLEELRRILRPGGYLLCSVLGSYDVKRQLDARDQARLQSEGSLTLEADNLRASYSTQVLRSWDVFQTRDQVLKNYGSVFEVLHYTDISQGQDKLVLRK